ncbi:MAG: hypothetical protein U9O96_03430 [Candidatus Thermoplasmatota archaeon]|nr:hypothetical protein [Candidatus Thermoplasmatota archaeon]
MSLRKRAVIPLMIAVTLILVSLSGCIGPKKVFQKLLEKTGEKQKYEWNEKLEDEKSFKFIDALNKNLVKIEEYPPIMVKGNTRYMHVYVNVTFSDFVDPVWKYIVPGYANITITDPSGVNVSREYSAFGKENEYKDFFYFAEPQIGNWRITLKIRGSGNYKIFAEIYEPV